MASELQRDWVECAFETASETLLGLLKTPQLTGLHFEFDISVGELPTMTYRVNRISLKEKEETE